MSYGIPKRDATPSHVRQALTEFKMANGPTVMKMRYRGTAELAQHTHEARTLAAAAGHAQRATEQAIAAHERIMADGTQTEGARLVRSARHARELMKNAEAAYTTALDAFESRYAQLNSARQAALKPPRDPGEAALFAAALEHVRHADGAALQRLVHDGDEVFALAVAAAPPEITGAANELRLAAQRRVFASRDPDAFAQTEDLASAFTVARQAIAHMRRDVAQVVDLAGAEELESSAAAAGVEA